MDALKSFAETLENELTCSICQGIFTDPITSQCLHSYCRKCIVECYEKRENPIRNIFVCPLCKTRIDVPDGDPSKLRSSFYLDSLLQLLHATKTKANQPGLSDCVNCEKPQVLVAFCPQCNGLICGECVNAHKAIKQVRDEHWPTMLNDFEQKNLDSFVQHQMLCKEKFHEKNKLEYYCNEETCRRSLCQKCAILYHQNHQMQSLEEASEEVKPAIKQDMDRANLLLEKYQQEIEQSEENMERIEKEFLVANREVDDAVQRVCRMANEHGRVMKAELNQMLHELKTANSEKQTDIKAEIKQVSDFKFHCEKLMRRNLAFEVIESKEVIHERCEILSKTPSTLCRKPIQRNTTVHYAVKEQVMQSLQDIGKIVKTVTHPAQCTIESIKKGFSGGFINEFEIITRNAVGEVCPKRIESIDVGIKDVEGNEVNKKVLIDKQTGKYRVTYKAETAGPYVISVNIGGKPINNSPQNVDILDVNELFKPFKTFRLPGKSKGKRLGLQSFAVNDCKQIAIADCNNHRILVSLDGKYFSGRLCQQGTGGSKLYKPFGVVFNEDKIIVSDCPDHNGRIQEFNLKGTYVRTIYRSEQWFAPRRICMDDDKNIAVCCLGNKDLSIKPSIKVFGKQEDLIHEFYTTVEFENEQPLYITYGNGKYFVSYTSCSCVGVFDENGVFLYKFGKRGKMDGQFNGLHGLAVYGSEMILVCDYNNHRVQLLTQEGQFISSFGSHGSGVGQMVGPTDVAVAGNGQVFVLDGWGNKVSVWDREPAHE